MTCNRTRQSCPVRLRVRTRKRYHVFNSAALTLVNTAIMIVEKWLGVPPFPEGHATTDKIEVTNMTRKNSELRMLVMIKILVSRLAVAPVSGLLVVRLLKLLEVYQEAHSHHLYVMNLERQSDVIAPRGVRNSKSSQIKKTRDRDYVT